MLKTWQKIIKRVDPAWLAIVADQPRSLSEMHQAKLYGMLTPGDLMCINDASMSAGRMTTFLKIESGFDVTCPIKVWDPFAGDRWYHPYDILRIELDPTKEQTEARILCPYKL